MHPSNNSIRSAYTTYLQVVYLIHRPNGNIGFEGGILMVFVLETVCAWEVHSIEKQRNKLKVRPEAIHNVNKKSLQSAYEGNVS